MPIISAIMPIILPTLSTVIKSIQSCKSLQKNLQTAVWKRPLEEHTTVMHSRVLEKVTNTFEVKQLNKVVADRANVSFVERIKMVINFSHNLGKLFLKVFLFCVNPKNATSVLVKLQHPDLFLATCSRKHAIFQILQVCHCSNIYFRNPEYMQINNQVILSNSSSTIPVLTNSANWITQDLGWRQCPWAGSFCRWPASVYSDRQTEKLRRYLVLCQSSTKSCTKKWKFRYLL